MLAFTKEFAIGAFGAICFMLLCLFAATASKAHHSEDWWAYYGPRMSAYIATRCGFSVRRYGLFASICGKRAYKRFMWRYWGAEAPIPEQPIEPPPDDVEVQSGPACTPSATYTCLKVRRRGSARRRSR